MYYFGNKTILGKHKTVFLCSRKCPADIILKSLDWAVEQKREGNCIISGFHSRIEKDVFDILINGKQPLILVLARGMKKLWPIEIRKAVEQNRLLIISPFNENEKHVTQGNANKRNEIMTEIADEIIIAYSTKNGNLHRLIQTIDEKKQHILA
ncbi:DNA-processing protein DprA [bacterium]|nr:DNA-processing protein DprA [bacterium]